MTFKDYWKVSIAMFIFCVGLLIAALITALLWEWHPFAGILFAIVSMSFGIPAMAFYADTKL